MAPVELATSEQLEILQKRGRCSESSSVRNSYTLCGFGGRIHSKPAAVNVSPWTGKLQEGSDLRFIVRARSHHSEWFPEPHFHQVYLDFQGVDSPVAWAAQKHGCQLLKNTRITHIVAASADATCYLLQLHCGAQLCELISREGLAGATVWSIHGKVYTGPLLTPDAMVSVLSCLYEYGVCGLALKWAYDATSRELHLKQHGARIPLATLMERMAQVGPSSVELLHRMHSGMDQQSVFQEACATAIWQLKYEPPTFLLRALAQLSFNMPQLLLQSLVASSTFDGFGQMSRKAEHALHEAFGNVTSLHVELQDASQLSQVARALEYCPGVEAVLLSCAKCSVIAREPRPEDWQAFFHHAHGLRRLGLFHFVLRMTDSSLRQALETALRRFEHLTEFKAVGLVIGPDAMPLTSGLAHCSELRGLDFSHQDLEQARMLLHGLIAFPPKSVTHFTFDGNNVGPDHGRLLIDLLLQLPRLKKLAITNNNLGDAIGKQLPDILRNLSLSRAFIVQKNNFSKGTELAIAKSCSACA